MCAEVGGWKAAMQGGGARASAQAGCLTGVTPVTSHQDLARQLWIPGHYKHWIPLEPCIEAAPWGEV